MRWLSKISISLIPLYLVLALVGTTFGQSYDPKSVASRINRTGDDIKQLNGIYFVDTNYFVNIQAAITAAGTTGTVLIPSNYLGVDSYTNPNSITILDLRPGKTLVQSDAYLPTIQTAGKILGSALPVPAIATLGGIFSKTCSGTDKVSALNTDGSVTCGTDQTSGAGTGITTLNGLVATTQSFAIGSSGTSPAFVSVTATHTLNLPFAHTASVTAGMLSNTEFLSLLVNNPGATQTVTATANGVTDIELLAKVGQTGDLIHALNSSSFQTWSVDSAGITHFSLPLSGQGAPFTVASTDLVTNLNANFLNGKSYAQINPMTVLGAMIYSADTLGTPAALAPNTTTTPKVLIQTGTGTLGTIPAWGSLVASMLPSQAMRTDVGNTVTTGKQDFSGSSQTLPDKVGTLASRPAFGTAGQTYYATDTKTAYRDNGTAWQVDGSGGGTLTSVTLPTTDFTVSGTTTLAFAWGGTNSTGAPTSANTPNAIVKRDGAGNITVGILTATSVVTSGPGNPAIDIPVQTPCVPGISTNGRIMFDGFHLVASEAGGACNAMLNAASALGGDLNGVVGNATIVALAGRAFDPSAPVTGNVLTWNGSSWTHTAPTSAIITSVFTRTGAVVATSGDYTAAQVTNAFDVTTFNDLTEIAPPGNPVAGKLRPYAKTGTEQLCVRNSTGTETCFGAGGSSLLSSIGSPTGSSTVNLAGFNWGLTQSANSTGDSITFTGFQGNTGSGNLVSIVSGGTTDPYVPLHVKGLNTGVVELQVQAASGQSVSIQEWDNNSGSALANISPAGQFRTTSGYAATSASISPIFFGFDSASTNLTGTVNVRGGDFTGTTAAAQGEPINVRGGDSGSSTGNAGNINIRGGDLTNATSATGQAGNLAIRPGANTVGGSTLNNGQLTISQVFVKGTTTTTGDLMCISGSFTVTDCATSSTVAIGIANGTVGTNAVIVAVAGSIITVNYDGTYSPLAGWHACASTTTAGKILPQSGACSTGQEVGLVMTAGSATTTGTILVRLR